MPALAVSRSASSSSSSGSSSSGPAVSTDYRQTAGQLFQYDGLSRIILSQNIAQIVGNSESSTSGGSGGGGVVAECVYVFDSLSRVLEEAQSLDTESSGSSGGGSVVTRYATNHAYFSAVISGVTYPNGRQIQNTYDTLYRRTQVADTLTPGSSSSSSSNDSSGGASAGYIAQWDFFGSRIAETRLANNITCTFMNNDRTHSAVQTDVPLPAWGTSGDDRLGYDGAGRMIAKRYIPSTLNESGGYEDTTPVVGFTTRFDKASNKFYERALHAENRSFLYIPMDEEGNPTGGIDSINRLLQYQRGNLAVGGGSVVTPLTLPGADASRTYDLDHLGNWKKSVYVAIPEPPETSSSSSISSEEEPTSNIDRRDHNALNQITRRKPANGDMWDVFAYDLNGNLLDDGERVMAYDSLNRLVQVARKSDGAVIGRYLYDAGNRRVQKVVTNSGLSGDIPNGTTDYFYVAAVWQICEERNDEDQPVRQYLWGIYIDELIQQRNNPGGIADVEANCYMLSGMLYSSTALTDESGDIVVAYDIDPYGNLIIFTSPGSTEGWWGNDADTFSESRSALGLQGLFYDNESSLTNSRSRFISSRDGRFIGRDGDNYYDSMNIYLYEKSNPAIHVDPMGFSCECPQNTCDKWRIDVREMVGGGAITKILAISTDLSADKECCMDTYKKRYVYTGGIIGPVAPGVAFSLKGGSHTFSTKCISFEDHIGKGSTSTFGIAIFMGVAITTAHTPQTTFREAGKQFGATLDIFVPTVGAWVFN